MDDGFALHGVAMKKNISAVIGDIKELVSDTIWARYVVGLVVMAVGMMLYPIQRTRIDAIKLVCWVGRVTNIHLLEEISFSIIYRLFLITTLNGCDTILSKNCFNSGFLTASESMYTVNGESEKTSLFRDIIILKEKTDYEKGVLLIKYTPAFDAFYNIFDINKIFNDYILVLEPSWAGVCDPSILMYWRNTNKTNVIVQAIEPKDYMFIEKLGGNFIPIAIGSSDWADQDLFYLDSDNTKEYDLIMVSNWGLHKKHKELFKALSKTKMHLSVLLIGFPWEGRTKYDIENEIKKSDLNHIKFEILENISAVAVADLMNKSKVYLLLSKKEGPNKAIVEAFMCNVPAILYDKFVGGAQVKINTSTGILSSYRDLTKNIEYMVKSYHNYSPREWILNNSGSTLSTNKLNMLLKETSIRNGDVWVNDIYEKVNAPNLGYKGKSYNILFWADISLKYRR